MLADLDDAPAAFAEALVRGVAEHQAGIDARLSAASTNWRLERMATVDRIVLRLGAFELLHRPDVPVGTAIDEAVTLAKRFSTAESGAFVNGVLSAIAADAPTRN